MTNYDRLNPAALEGRYAFDSAFFWNLEINGYPIVMMAWNIALAAFAVWLAYRLGRSIAAKERPALTTTIAAAWLLMLPNAAYLMADVRHIIGYCPVGSFGRVCADHAWMSIFFFAYGLFGFIGFVLAIRPVEAAVAKRYGRRATLIGLAVVIPLTALGVLLGLVNRWNSWDVFVRPLAVLEHAASYALDPLYFKNWLCITVLFFFLYYFGKRILAKADWEE